MTARNRATENCGFYKPDEADNHRRIIEFPAAIVNRVKGPSDASDESRWRRFVADTPLQPASRRISV